MKCPKGHEVPTFPRVGSEEETPIVTRGVRQAWLPGDPEIPARVWCDRCGWCDLPTTPTDYVIAGNYPEFVDWCDHEGVSPRDRSVVYVRGPEILRGRLIEDYDREHRVGTWYQRSDIDEIEKYMRVARVKVEAQRRYQ